MKRSWFVWISILFLNLVNTTTFASSPSELFKFGSIPFGKTEKEVLKLLKGTKIRKVIDKEIYFYHAQMPEAPTKYEWGYNDRLVTLDPILSIEYVVYTKKWKQHIPEFFLNFVRDSSEKSPYRLIAVQKIIDVLKSTDDEQAFMSALVKQISEKIGKEPYAFSIDDLAATWETDSMIISVQYDLSRYIYSHTVRVSYIDKKAWQKYLAYEKDWKIRKMKRAEEKAKSKASEF